MRQDSAVCVVSGGVNESRDRRTSAFSVGVRPAVALRRPTHCDTDQARNAPVWRSADSVHTAITPDTTKQSCRRRVWRAGVNWTIAINFTNFLSATVLSCLWESGSHRRSGRDRQDSFVVSGAAV